MDSLIAVNGCLVIFDRNINQNAGSTYCFVDPELFHQLPAMLDRITGTAALHANANFTRRSFLSFSGCLSNSQLLRLRKKEMRMLASIFACHVTILRLRRRRRTSRRLRKIRRRPRQTRPHQIRLRQTRRPTIHHPGNGVLRQFQFPGGKRPRGT